MDNDYKMSKAVSELVEERQLRVAGERYTKFLKMYLPGEQNFYRVEEDQNQNFEKIDGALETLQRMSTDLFSDKYDKTGGDINGQVNIVSEEGKARTLAIINKGEDGTFAEFITASGRKGWIGRGSKGSNSIVVKNDVSGKALSVDGDGKAYYDGTEILTRRIFDPKQLDDKYDKTGGTISGNVFILGGDLILESLEGKAKVFQVRSKGEDGTFAEFITASGRKGWIGRGYKNAENIEIKNDISGESLSLEPNGELLYGGNDVFVDNVTYSKLETTKKTMIEAINENKENIDTNKKNADNSLNDKYNKTGGDINGQVNIVSEEGKARTLAIINKGEDGTFAEFITASGRKGWIGRGSKGSNSIVVKNDTSQKSLSLEENGKLLYGGYEVWDENNIQGLLKERIKINGINRNLEIKIKEVKATGKEPSIVFDTAFATACFGVFIVDITTEYINEFAVVRYSRSGFDLLKQYSASDTFIYMAIGY